MTARPTGRSAARQLVLDIAGAPSFAAEDFLVAGCNQAAFAAITAWPSWPDRVMLLLGPAGAGKSHLAHMWAMRAGASVDASALDRLRGVILIEDCDRRRIDEPGLFHLLNRIREGDGWAMITARTPPGSWRLTTPDLVSRLRLAPTVTIGHPDDALLRAVLVKLFTDRQLLIDDRLVAFVARRCDQSLDAIRDFVAAVDEAALASGQRVTRQLASTVLEALAAPQRSLDEPA